MGGGGEIPVVIDLFPLIGGKGAPPAFAKQAAEVGVMANIESLTFFRDSFPFFPPSPHFP